MSSFLDSNVYEEKMGENEDELSKRQMLDDLQLAAELGNTLLERNKELEKCLRQQQNTIDDQALEIEYLNKQTVALREVNDSRLRVYEQLEVGIHELELQNHRFAIESTNDKKQIKTLLETIEQNEERYDELQKNFDDLQRQLTLHRQQNQQQRKSSNVTTPTSQNNHNGSFDHSDFDNGKTRLRINGTNGTLCNNQDNIQTTLQEKTNCNSSRNADYNTDTVDGRLTDDGMDTISNNDTNEVYSSEYNDEIIQLLKELADERAQRTRDQRRVTELEEQMTGLLRQIQTLEQQLLEFEQKEVMTSMHEEISTLEEVRDGHLCGRCLRHVDEHARDELSAMLNQEHSIIYEDESSVQSLNNSVISDTIPYKTTLSLEIQAGASPEQQQNTNENNPTKVTPYERANPYRELVEKYEALLSVEASVPRSKRNHRKPPPPTKSLSLQEELQMSGDFNSLSTKDTDDESGHGGMKVYRNKKFTNSRTPTDFSEAETSSSGFSDETSNKATQTEKLGIPIGDETDKICIYNDAIDSGFPNHPKYRELFKEIFQKLKTGPETKEEKTKPTITEDVQSDFTDDCQSVTSYTNSEMSTTLVEPAPVKVTQPTTPEKTIEKPTVLVTPVSKAKKIKSRQIIQKPDVPVSPPQEEDPPTPKHKSEAQIVLTPYRREPLELPLGVQLRKKSSSRKNALRKTDRCESPVLPLSPKILYSSRLGNSPNGRANQKRRDFKPVETPARALTDSSPVWNGDTLQFWSSKQVPTTNGGITTSHYLPSTASQDFSKLKKLEVTYAEALRNADKKKLSRNNGGQSNRRSK